MKSIRVTVEATDPNPNPNPNPTGSLKQGPNTVQGQTSGQGQSSSLCQNHRPYFISRFNSKKPQISTTPEDQPESAQSFNPGSNENASANNNTLRRSPFEINNNATEADCTDRLNTQLLQGKAPETSKQYFLRKCKEITGNGNDGKPSLDTVSPEKCKNDKTKPKIQKRKSRKSTHNKNKANGDCKKPKSKSKSKPKKRLEKKSKAKTCSERDSSDETDNYVEVKPSCSSSSNSFEKESKPKEKCKSKSKSKSKSRKRKLEGLGSKPQNCKIKKLKKTPSAISSKSCTSNESASSSLSLNKTTISNTQKKKDKSKKCKNDKCTRCHINVSVSVTASDATASESTSECESEKNCNNQSKKNSNKGCQGQGQTQGQGHGQPCSSSPKRKRCIKTRQTQTISHKASGPPDCGPTPTSKPRSKPRSKTRSRSRPQTNRRQNCTKEKQSTLIQRILTFLGLGRKREGNKCREVKGQGQGQRSKPRKKSCSGSGPESTHSDRCPTCGQAVPSTAQGQARRSRSRSLRRPPRDSCARRPSKFKSRSKGKTKTTNSCSWGFTLNSNSKNSEKSKSTTEKNCPCCQKEKFECRCACQKKNFDATVDCNSQFCELPDTGTIVTGGPRFKLTPTLKPHRCRCGCQIDENKVDSNNSECSSQSESDEDGQNSDCSENENSSLTGCTSQKCQCPYCPYKFVNVNPNQCQQCQSSLDVNNILVTRELGDLITEAIQDTVCKEIQERLEGFEDEIIEEERLYWAQYIQPSDCPQCCSRHSCQLHSSGSGSGSNCPRRNDPGNQNRRRVTYSFCPNKNNRDIEMATIDDAGLGTGTGTGTGFRTGTGSRASSDTDSETRIRTGHSYQNYGYGDGDGDGQGVVRNLNFARLNGSFDGHNHNNPFLVKTASESNLLLEKIRYFKPRTESSSGSSSNQNNNNGNNIGLDLNRTQGQCQGQGDLESLLNIMIPTKSWKS